MSSLDQELRMALTTGKVYLGSKMALKELKRGRARVAIVSSNCPEDVKMKISQYSKLLNIPLLTHSKNSVDLGTLCGKPFPVSVIVINETGNSKILNLGN
ncbi:50S ribosomal protein L30e [Candidatus Bathyarchaeota archaeon]|nr:50S ribosomal protein L30e [Candidatus Bathyarchaeota archaeon]MBS7630135.1 50S ribosomal protein L30e [Candidatus Bathyarchaeota archaeon]